MQAEIDLKSVSSVDNTNTCTSNQLSEVIQSRAVTSPDINDIFKISLPLVTTNQNSECSYFSSAALGTLPMQKCKLVSKLGETSNIINSSKNPKPYSEPSLSFEELQTVLAGDTEKDFNWLRRFLTGYGSYWMLHFIYFCTISLFFGTISYLIEAGSVQYIDSLFIAVSASTMTGLTSYDFSKYSFPSQFLTLFLFILGNVILTSLIPVIIRRHFYRRRARLAFDGLKELKNIEASLNEKNNIHNLLQREVTEYQALSILLFCVLTYFFILQSISFFFLILYLFLSNSSKMILKDSSINIWFFGLFHTISSFNNCGFTLTSNNMVSFIKHRFLLSLTCINILLGNTFYPPMLRLYIWFIHRVIKKKKIKSILSCFPFIEKIFLPHTISSVSKISPTSFLLKNPRKCFTHMFDRHQTIILVSVSFCIILIQFISFMPLEYSKSYMNALPTDLKFLLGFFQNVSIRTAGFNAFDIYDSAKAMQLLWVLFMYVSPYPFIMALTKTSTELTNQNASVRTDTKDLTVENCETAVRPYISTRLSTDNNINDIQGNNTLEDLNTHLETSSQKESIIIDIGNVNWSEYVTKLDLENRERSLTMENHLNGMDKKLNYFTKDWKFVIHTTQRLLLKDLFWLLLVTFLICLFEDRKFSNHPRYLNIFSIFFEIISAYGTVGLSLGFSGINSSLSTKFTSFSKCLIIIVMLLGRHRGLPSSIDKAVNVIDLLNVSVFSIKKKNKLYIFNKIRRCVSQPCNVAFSNITQSKKNISRIFFHQ